MTPEHLLALIGIFAAAVWTPGPNNAMLAASGATFGFRRTVPHLTGVALGFGLMMFLVGIGLGQVFETLPVLKDILRIVGIVLLIWVAWRIANSRAPGSPGARTQPFTFLQAAAFQWVNPKAWTMCISIAAQFVTAANTVVEAAIVAAVSVVIGLTSSSGWTGFGAMLQRILRDPGALRLFNLSMAMLVLLGVVYLGIDLFA